MVDDLHRELGRLETTLAGADAPNASVIDELSKMRGELAARGSDPRTELRLPNVRVASPCKQRWDDMVGDARVRVCNGCERPVFNLSEMTRDDAEAVLATRGVTPCVRFYRRTDGTVMTADCPTGAGARRSRRLAVVAAGTTLMSASAAMADPAPGSEDPPPTQAEAEPPVLVKREQVELAPLAEDPCAVPTSYTVTMGIMISEPAPKHPAIEWSTWVRGGYGKQTRVPANTAANAAARSVTPPMVESGSTGELALGADVTLGLTDRGNVRIGAWAETRTTSSAVFGGEVLLAGFRGLPRFGAVLRVGGNRDVFTTAIGFGFSDTDPTLPRHATGVRLVTSVTSSERELFATVGLELDPIGVIGGLVRRARR
jgi:hypothetical protein